MEARIFEGLKVIDCASFIAAPGAATVLADFGADVIKIEPPGVGDPYRLLPKLPGYPVSEHNYVWLLESRNKKSLALDLSKPEGQAVIHRLAAECDVFITNYAPDLRQRLGVSYEKLASLNERMIYAAFTGYGESGEEANKPGFDTNAWWGRSGLMDLVRPDADGPPARSLPGMGDHPSAMSLFGAIVTALYRRERTGKGAKVTSSLIANGVWSNGCYVQARLCGAKVSHRPPREKALNALANHYLCRDGRWIILSILSEERQWPAFAACVGGSKLANDVRFADKKGRHANSRALVQLLDEIFSTKDLAEWRNVLDAAGVVFGVVATVDDLLDDEQMQVAEVLVPFENETMLTINSPLWIEGAGKVPPRRAPAVGEHSEEVLRAAGYHPSEIEQLKARGIVA